MYMPTQLLGTVFTKTQKGQRGRPSLSVGVEHGRQFPTFGDETDGKGVDAVACILLREAFAFEDVAQVAAAVCANYLRATSIRVGTAFDAAWVFFIEARPATARLELSLCRVKRIVAAPTNKGAGRIQSLVLTAERSFCSLADDDSFFLC